MRFTSDAWGPTVISCSWSQITENALTLRDLRLLLRRRWAVSTPLRFVATHTKSHRQIDGPVIALRIGNCPTSRLRGGGARDQADGNHRRVGEG